MPRKIDTEFLKKLRHEVESIDSLTQRRINEIYHAIKGEKTRLLPRESNEILSVVDSSGKNTNLSAPRWICHLLGLRHQVVHVLLEWPSDEMGNMCILQIRSWDKSDSPGTIDISIGGHVKGKGATTPLATAYSEMNEEFGLKKEDLKNGRFDYVGGYENYEIRKQENFFNREWRALFSGMLKRDRINKIFFSDREVVGLYLCTEAGANDIIKQNIIPIANALRGSLPCFL